MSLGGRDGGGSAGGGGATGAGVVEAFMGVGVVSNVKSFALLSLSVTSPSLLFRSRLWLLGGLAATVPSNELAVPNPTRSTMVCPASEKSTTVLLLARDSCVL